MSRRRAHERGVTLIELMLVLAIAGILVVMSLGFAANLPRRERWREALRETYNAMAIARSEAIKRGKVVAVNLGPTHLYAFVDENDNNIYDSGDTLVHRFPHDDSSGERLPSTVSFASEESFGGMPTVFFDSQGFTVNSTSNMVARTVTVSDGGLGASTVIDATAAGALRVRN
jgi:type IV fimbrial biogenesis protein FimT